MNDDNASFIEFIKIPTREAYARLSFMRMRDYLTANGWKAEEIVRFAEYWSHPTARCRVVVPLTNAIGDYPHRMREAVEDISIHQKISEWDAYVAVRDWSNNPLDDLMTPEGEAEMVALKERAREWFESLEGEQQ